MPSETDSAIKTWEGDLTAAGLRFAIVVARFNSFITDRLLAGCLDALRRSGAQMENVELVKVPGSWEMPIVVRELARQKRFDDGRIGFEAWGAISMLFFEWCSSLAIWVS